MNTIHIDICIPFYLYGECPNRINITKMILNHYTEIIKHCRNTYNSDITMTFIGSEKNISENFIKNNFHEIYTYYEFDQINCKIGYSIDFLDMLTNKFRFAYKKSMEKNPHISLLAGSNDFISTNFFEQIITAYNPNIKQLFGIDNFYNGNNKTALDLYNGSSFLNNLVWTTGLSNYCDRKKYKYIGGIIGFNNTLYKDNYNQLMNTIITYDEGEIEFNTLKLADVIKFQSQNVFLINIKTKTKSEITSFDTLKELTKTELIYYANFDSNFQKNFTDEYTHFLSKYKTHSGKTFFNTYKTHSNKTYLNSTMKSILNRNGLLNPKKILIE